MYVPRRGDIAGVTIAGGRQPDGSLLFGEHPYISRPDFPDAVEVNGSIYTLEGVERNADLFPSEALGDTSLEWESTSEPRDTATGYRVTDQVQRGTLTGMSLPPPPMPSKEERMAAVEAQATEGAAIGVRAAEEAEELVYDGAYDPDAAAAGEDGDADIPESNVTRTGHPRCTARANSGIRCNNAAIPGGTICRKHGGAAPQVRQAAVLRLLQLEQPMITVLVREATQADKSSDRREAAKAVLAYIDKVRGDAAAGAARALLLERLLTLRAGPTGAEGDEPIEVEYTESTAAAS